MKRLVILINSIPIFLTMIYTIGTLFFGMILFSVFYLIIIPLVNIILDIIFIKKNKKSKLVSILLLINIVIFLFWLLSSILICKQIVNGFDSMSFWMKLYVILDLDNLIHSY